MKTYPVKTPNLLKAFFKKLVWSFNTKEKEIYLTFDDGPIPQITPWVLEQLRIYNAKATFFCIGDNIRKHPEILKQIISENHKIGNHTFNHLNGWKNNNQTYIENILLTEEHISQKNSSKIFRPPYGKTTPKQVKKLIEMGYQIIMWDVLSGDFDNTISHVKCTKNVLNNVSNGSIVVFHDSIKAFPRLKETLPRVLKELKDKGYCFKVIP